MIKDMKSCRLPKAASDFLSSINFKYNKEDIILFKNHFYLASFTKVCLDNIKINRYGLDLGEMVKDRFEPSHALAMYHNIDKSLFIEVNPIPVKAAMNLMGMDVGKLRLPLTEISEKNLEILRNNMIKYGIEIN